MNYLELIESINKSSLKVPSRTYQRGLLCTVYVKTVSATRDRPGRQPVDCPSLSFPTSLTFTSVAPLCTLYSILLIYARNTTHFPTKPIFCINFRTSKNMAGYFSNHSRLHNASGDVQSATQAGGGGNTRSSTPASARAPSDPPRPRAMSKHFSTSVQPASGVRTGTPPVGPDGQMTVHPLRTTYVRYATYSFPMRSCLLSLLLVIQLGVLVPCPTCSGR
jgi:hypothetical protein